MATADPQHARIDQVLRLVALFSTALVTIAYLANAIAVVPNRLMCDFNIGSIEPAVAVGSLRIADGQPIYRDIRTSRPIDVLSYGILEYQIPGLLAKAVSGNKALLVLKAGRSQSFICFLAIIFVLAVLARQRGAEWKYGLIAWLPLIWFPYPFEWAAKFAPDFPALLCSLAGWLLASSADRVSGSRRIVLALLAGGVWAAGFHFKPIVIPGQIAFALEAVAGFRTSRRADEQWTGNAARFSPLLIYAGVSVLVSCVLHFATHGLWTQNTLTSLRLMDYRPSNFLAIMSKPSGSLHLPELVLMITIALLLIRQERLFAAYLCCAAVEILMMFKQGSASNYLLGSVSLWGLSFALWLRQTLATAYRERLVRVAYVALTGLCIALLPGLSRAGMLSWDMIVPPQSELAGVALRAKQLPPDSILCLDGFVGQYCSIPYLYSDGVMTSILLKKQFVSIEDVLERVRNRRYALIIANYYMPWKARYQNISVCPEPLLNAINEHYTVDSAARWLVLYRPKDTAK